MKDLPITYKRFKIKDDNGKNTNVVVRLKTCQKYPFNTMGVGESFIFSDEYTRDIAQKAGISARAFCRQAENDWKFSVKKIDNKVVVIRIK